MTTKTTTIIDYPDYSVDTEGTVYNKYGKKLRPQAHKGYDSVYLYKNKVRRKLRVHRLVAHTFLGLDLNDAKAQVHHIDSVRDNNRLDNLEILSNRENCLAKVRDNKTSKYIGVTKRKNGTYKAQIWVNGTNVSLGSFDNEYDAHVEYMKASTELLETTILG